MKPIVIIPVKNRLDLTKPLVEELLSHNDCLIVIQDNGSTDETAAWAKGVDRLVYLDCAAMTLHEMWNEGIDLANRDNVPLIILNNDLELDGKRKWASRLCDPFKLGWGALCPNYDGRASYRTVDPLRGISAGREDGTGGMSGFAFAIAPPTLGWYRFPEEAKWWFGDTDFCRSMDERNVGYGMVIDVGVTHIGGGSQTAKDYDLDGQCAKDQEWYESKWGALAG